MKGGSGEDKLFDYSTAAAALLLDPAQAKFLEPDGDDKAWDAGIDWSSSDESSDYDSSDFSDDDFSDDSDDSDDSGDDDDEGSDDEESEKEEGVSGKVRSPALSSRQAATPNSPVQASLVDSKTVAQMLANMRMSYLHRSRTTPSAITVAATATSIAALSSPATSPDISRESTPFVTPSDTGPSSPVPGPARPAIDIVNRLRNLALSTEAIDNTLKKDIVSFAPETKTAPAPPPAPAPPAAPAAPDSPPTPTPPTPPPPPAAPFEKPETDPNKVLQNILRKNGYGEFETFSAHRVKNFFEPISPSRISAYSLDVVSAVRARDLPALRDFHKKGFDLSCCNRYGESILHLTCRRGSADVLNFLIQEAKVSVRVKDDYGRTPLHDACWTTSLNKDVAGTLIQICPDLLLVRDMRGFPPLQYASKERWPDWCSFLLEKADDIRPSVLLRPLDQQQPCATH